MINDLNDVETKILEGAAKEIKDSLDERMMKIVRLAFPNTVRANIFQTWPMDKPHDESTVMEKKELSVKLKRN